MTQKRLITLSAIVLTFSLVGFAAYATGPGAKLISNAGTFFGHGHGGGHFGHGHGHAAHMHCMMGKFVEELDLTDSQHEYLENVHKILQDKVHGAFAGHGEHAEELVEMIEQGNLDSADIRQKIDGHIEGAREIAYSVADELVAFVNSLDDEQRAKLAKHVKEAHGHMAARHGHKPCAAKSDN